MTQRSTKVSVGSRPTASQPNNGSRLTVSQPDEVVVVLVGDARVGKTCLATRFCEHIFIQNYAATTFNRYITESTVGQRQVRFTIWDTSGGKEQQDTTRSLVTREADVVLVCYNISDPQSLFSAIDFWVPEVRSNSPSVPLVLVGCQSDQRAEASTVDRLARQGQTPVSSQQALFMSQQIEAVMYVETSAKTSSRGVASAMEVAALTALGQITSPGLPPPPPQQQQQKLHQQQQQQYDSAPLGRLTPSHLNGPNSSSPCHPLAQRSQQTLSPIHSPVRSPQQHSHPSYASSAVQSPTTPVQSPLSHMAGVGGGMNHTPLSPVHTPLSSVHHPHYPHQRQSSLTPSSSSTPSPMVNRKTRNRSVSVTRNQQQNNRSSQLMKTKDGLSQSKDESLLSLEPTEAFWDQFNAPVSPSASTHSKDNRLAIDKPSDSPGPSARNLRRSPRSPSLNPIHGSPVPGSGGSSSVGLGGGGSPMHQHTAASTRSPSLGNRNKLMGSLSSMSMRSKSSTLSSTKSDTSMQSITTNSRNTISITTKKTPKVARKTGNKDKDKQNGGQEEKMITIKCQRLTADRTYEEVEIEVPAPIYETMQNYTETGSPLAGRQSSKSEKRGGGGLGTKIKCLFSKTAN